MILAWIYLRAFESAFSWDSGAALLRGFYWIFPWTSWTNVSLLFKLMNIESSRLYRFDRANGIGQRLFTLWNGGSVDLDADQRFTMIMSAAYSGDLELLTQMRDARTFLPPVPGLLEYVEALLALDSGGRSWMRWFSDCRKTFDSSQPESQLKPEYVEQASNFFDPDLTDSVFRQAIGRLDRSVVVPRSQRAKLIVSCDVLYFSIFSEFFCSNVRKLSSIPIHIVVVVVNQDDRASALQQWRKLQYLSDIEIELVQVPDDVAVGVFSSTARFLAASKTMRKFGMDVIVSDIDLKIDFDVEDIFSNLRSSIGLPRFDACLVPWARLNAGLAFFRSSPMSLMFLSLLAAYLEFAIRNGANWTLDQAALYVTWTFCREHDYDFTIEDVGLVITTSASRRVPRRLRKRKFEAKSLTCPTASIESVLVPVHQPPKPES
jgi:glycerol-3-phosphate cytidylyltransferase-like family protein